jgi:hypothetical protein
VTRRRLLCARQVVSSLQNAFVVHRVEVTVRLLGGPRQSRSCPEEYARSPFGPRAVQTSLDSATAQRIRAMLFTLSHSMLPWECIYMASRHACTYASFRAINVRSRGWFTHVLETRQRSPLLLRVRECAYSLAKSVLSCPRSNSVSA